MWSLYRFYCTAYLVSESFILSNCDVKSFAAPVSYIGLFRAVRAPCSGIRLADCHGVFNARIRQSPHYAAGYSLPPVDVSYR